MIDGREAGGGCRLCPRRDTPDMAPYCHFFLAFADRVPLLRQDPHSIIIVFLTGSTPHDNGSGVRQPGAAVR